MWISSRLSWNITIKCALNCELEFIRESRRVAVPSHIKRKTTRWRRHWYECYVYVEMEMEKWNLDANLVLACHSHALGHTNADTKRVAVNQRRKFHKFISHCACVLLCWTLEHHMSLSLSWVVRRLGAHNHNLDCFIDCRRDDGTPVTSWLDVRRFH